MRNFKRAEAIILSAFIIIAIFAGFGSSVSAAAKSSIASVVTYGNYETAGIDLKVDSMNFNESAKLEYKKQSDSTFKEGHYFVRYDGNHMATSLFNLESNTKYDIRVTLTDPDGVSGGNVKLTTVTTKPEFSMPTPKNKYYVNNQAALDYAIKIAKAGDEIRLAPGIYSDIAFSSKSGTNLNPIVITSQTQQKPLIEGSIYLTKSNYIIVNNLEIHNEKSEGIFIRGSHHDTIRKCYIHDSGPDTSNIRIGNSDLGVNGSGYHLIIDNIISDEVHQAIDTTQGPGASNSAAEGQCYYGISMYGNPGGFTTIRGNVIFGVVDGMHTGGDEGTDPLMDLNDKDYLKNYTDQNVDVYDNIIYNCKDDDIETDGHMTNGRFFRNNLGVSECSISTAVNYPGPQFFVRNVVSGWVQQCSKTNTKVPGVSRNCFFYNNTFVQRDPVPNGDNKCFYQGEAVQLEKFTYIDNIFYARGRVYDGDMYNGNPDSFRKDRNFDYNLLFSTREISSKDFLFKWPFSVEDNRWYNSLAEFQAGTGQDLHSKYADPKVDFTQIEGNYPTDAWLRTFKISSDSPAVDAAEVIPGINDNFVGAGPDMGAYEYGTAPTPTPTPEPTYEPTPTGTGTPIPTPTPASIKIKVLNSFVKFTSAPVSVSGTILAEGDKIAKSLGAAYKYNTKTKAVTITKGKITIVFTINSKKAKMGSKSYNLTAAPKIYNVPFVPVKFVAERYGYKYSYSSVSKIVTIKK